jgi:hypothetical protein
MDADLDLLLIAVYVTADDLLPTRPGNARRSVTDAEVVTLCVAQAIMRIPSDRRFLAVASKHLRHLFPSIPGQAGYYKRRRRLADTLEWLMGVFASQSPGFEDDLLLVDSTPVECARSRETVKRSRLADAADYGYCASHSRFFWGFRLHALCSPDGTPRAIALTSPKLDEREVALKLLARAKRSGAVTLIRRQGLCRQRVRESGQRPAGHDRAPPPKRRARSWPTSRADPPKDREHLLDLQGHPHPRAPRRQNPPRPPRAHPATPPDPHSRHHPQPPTRPTKPRTRQLLRLTPVESII